MQITTILLAAFAGIAAAQSSVSTAAGSKPSGCAAQNIVDACLVTTKAEVQRCGPNDYRCLCQSWTDVSTCYNNCPGHPDSFGAEQSKVSFCNAASAMPTTTASATSGATSATSAVASTSSGAVRVSGTSSAASPSGTTKNAAVMGRVVDGGLAMAVLGLMGGLVL